MNKYIVSAICIAMLSTGCGKIRKELRGPQGESGQQGATGAQGSAGQDGQDGTDGTNGILAVIDPCGDAPGIIDEVLIRLADGSVLVSFSANANGQNTRLSVLPAGNYVTTDGSSCHFTVTASGQVQ